MFGIFDQQTRSNSLTSVSEAFTEKTEQKLNRKCKCKEIKNVLSLFILRQTLTLTHTQSAYMRVCACAYLKAMYTLYLSFSHLIVVAVAVGRSMSVKQ